MKKKFIVLLFSVLVFMLLSINSFAQKELPKSQMFLMHEDIVLPFMYDKYENAAKGFMNMMKDSKIDDRSYNVIQSDYFNFTYIIPVKDYDGLAKYFGMSPQMIDKIGKEKFESQMSKFDGCYNTHRNYLLNLRNDLSYKPEYALNPDDGINYRHIDYFYPVPGKEDEAMEVVKEWKALCESKKIDEGYRVYVGGLGTEMNVILIVQPAKSRVDFATLSDRQDEILGKDGEALWNKMLAVTQKFEHHDGRMRPDLSLRMK